MRPQLWRTLRSPAVLGTVLLLVLLPAVLQGYYLHIATLALVYAALASAWNIVGGFTGQISLAHSVFVGIGAVLPAALLLRSGIAMWAGVGLAAALSGAVGAGIALIDFRFRLGRLSFALITLAIAEMGELIVLNSEFLGGASGLMLPPDRGRWALFEFGGASGAYGAILALALLCVLVNLVVINAPLGFFLRTIRDNEAAAQGLGVNLLRNKARAMAISAVLTSLVGSVYARQLSFVDPYLLASPTLTIEVVLFATIGGLGMPFGPALGALLLVPAGEILRGRLGGVLPGLHAFFYGLVVVIVVLAVPRGIGPALLALFGRRRAAGLSARPVTPPLAATTTERLER